MRRQSTDAERLLWSKLRDRRMMNCKFRRQLVGRYLVDFVCRKHNLVVELDGGHHADQQDYDAVRTERLQSQGFEVLRFWDNDVLTQLESVLESIGEALERRGASYSPSPPYRGTGQAPTLSLRERGSVSRGSGLKVLFIPIRSDAAIFPLIELTGVRFSPE